jgi:serine/threonine-protein kinase
VSSPGAERPSGSARVDEPRIGDERLMPGTIVGNYRLIDCIGQGSFALVYRAEHTHLEREVAIKILRGSISEEESFRERFRREAVAAAKIVHPNVVGVFDFGETHDGLAYLVMEWVKGKTLHRSIAERQQFPPERAAHLLKEIASGLAQAHKLGLVHRDLKSGNIMLAEIEGPAAESAKIVDFGLVRATFDENRLTQAGQVLGTPQFMDPEMIVGRDVSPSTDLYALGVIGFQILTGKLPFSGKTPIDIMRKQVTESPPPLPASRGLERVVAELMQKESRLRPPNAESVVQAIESLGIRPWQPSDPEMLRTEAGPPAMYETTPVVTAPRISSNDSPMPIQILQPTIAQRAMLGAAASSGELAISYDTPKPRARWWVVAGIGIAVVAMVAAASARWLYESSAPEAIVSDASGMARPSVQPTVQPIARAMPPEDEAQNLSEPMKESHRAKRTRAPEAKTGAEKPTADVGALVRDLDRVLAERGLDARDLGSFDDLSPRFDRFEAAVHARDAAEAEKALFDLRTALDRTPISGAFLKAKLGRVNALIQKAKDVVPPADLSRFETEYLDLAEALGHELKPAEAVAIAKRIKRLDIQLRPHVH